MEEDIKILETVVNYRKFDGIYSTTEVIFEAIEKLLKEYKEQEEKNKIIKDAYWNECIPKSLIKEKIEELDKKRIKMEKDDIGVGFTLGKEWSDLKAKIQILKELLNPLKNVQEEK